MDLKDIQELVKMMSKSGLAEFKLKQGDFELVLRSESGAKSGSNAPAQVVQMAQAPAPIAPLIEKKAAATVVQAPAENSETKPASKLLEIKSPMVGTFYRSPSPDKPPYIKVGDPVAVGQVVCMIEAMKLFNEIESEIKGTVVKIMVDDATPVEYDQVLFLIEPA